MKVNVVIAKTHGAQFEVEGCGLGHAGAIAIVSLWTQGQRRVRSHFERLCPEDWVQEAATARETAREQAAEVAATEARRRQELREAAAAAEVKQLREATGVATTEARSRQEEAARAAQRRTRESTLASTTADH